ncbi:Endonuclease/Exonuclease/phosphatase family protein [Thermomonospora echinospora]|uniref:Endonuclease/Exonuclease/phosphatase family protein n=1 Tax=Thermomonospora echinospora TaxID=1992 RepID=A0A1H5X375_9ACTN|nr:endonuclease/exonuclease/phosphatase family protein [Thermomonospora echinospora]SEG06201.1 Endonuclease/Exonuclease/phosphatase family protein [Thermomonospora echinospora]
MRHTGLRAVSVAGAGLALAAVTAVPALADGGHRQVRFATFNASLNRNAEGALVADLSTPGNAQARTIAETVQRTRPDVLLINEFDFDAEGRAARLFQDNYLSVGQNGAAPIGYRYRYTAPSNTGIASGLDLNNDGKVVTRPGEAGYGDDAYGFGAFPGQYGMAVYSRYPIDERRIRTFQKFRWKDMPGALLPDDPATSAPADWYSPAELDAVRLSSKSHWDVPVKVGGRTVHFLVSHPTPPTFDGPEDRNGRRNHDEIRLWADYVRGGKAARYIYDDRGRRGGLAPGAAFVIAGDQNADPLDGDSVNGAVNRLLEHPRVDASVIPTSAGAPEAAALQGGANAAHRGDPAHDTADFADGAPGNLRVDYVLPSRRLRPVRGGVFWPVAADPLSRLTGVFPFPGSDHRLVWLDVRG